MALSAILIPFCVQAQAPKTVTPHAVTFMNVEYDFPSDGQSTWFYRVESAGSPAISHVVFELICPDVVILDAGTWNGVDPASRNSGAGKPEPKKFPATPKRDPTSNVTGLKFDQEFNDRQSRYYYFTLNKNYATSEINYAIKAAWWIITGSVTGPDCDESPPPTPPAMSLTKTGAIVYKPMVDCDVFGPAVPFNALIFGNFTAVGGDTENRLAIGGDAHFSGGYSVGIPLYGNPIPTFYGDEVDMLIVAGDLHDDNWGVNGNVVYGGTRYGPERQMANGNIVRQVTPVTFDADGNVPEDGSGMNFADLQARMIARSAQLGALPDRGVVGMVLISPHHMQLIGEDPQLNVFNLTAPPEGILNSQIDIIAPYGSTVLLNILGEEVRYINGTITLAGVTRERVLYNYVDASRLEISGFTHEGSVLAPRLTSATLIGGSVEGQAVLGGDVVTHTGYEFHNYPFEGSICVEADVLESHIVYDFAISNDGQTPLTDVMVTDDLLTVEGGPITLAPGATDNTTFSGVYLLTPEDIARGSFSNSATASGRAPNGTLVTATDYDVRLFAQPGPYIHTEHGTGRRLRAAAPSATVMLYAGIHTGVLADWWLVALPQQGDRWYYMNADGQWTDVVAGDYASMRPALQGPLHNVFSPLSILPPGLIMPPGTHTLIFAVDPMDGILNYPDGPILLDSTEITVTD